MGAYLNSRRKLTSMRTTSIDEYSDKILQMRIIVNACSKEPLKFYAEIVFISHSIFVLSVFVGNCVETKIVSYLYGHCSNEILYNIHRNCTTGRPKNGRANGIEWNVDQRQPTEIAASVLFIVILRRMRTSDLQQQLFSERLLTVFTWSLFVCML